MSVTREQVVDALMPDEPDYDAASLLGEDALPHLEALIGEPDVRMAARATSLAGRLGRRAAPLLRRAARIAAPVVRVQAAAAARRLPAEEAAEIAGLLLDDEDAGVRKTVLRTVEARFGTAVPPVLAARLAKLATSDPAPFVRTLAGQLMGR
jgi:HEAT repeat protein